MEKNFPKTIRITNGKEISRILKNGQTWKCPCFNIKFISACHENRYAVIVSKRHGNAVKRNRIKRIFRETVRLNNGEKPPFFDCLLLPQVIEKYNSNEINEYFLKWQGTRNV